MPGQPMINFSVHEVRAGIDGAHADFEQMLALLVQATRGEAHLVFANQGDWGIDVLVGNLRGQVTIWQAKYFVRGFGESQQGQVRDSFAAALKAASEQGYEVARWILCLPTSMDKRATRWWQGWQARQQDSGVEIELWDETRLRELLLRPEAAHVRRHYYNPYRHDDAADERGRPTEPGSAPAAGDPEPAAAWVGGAEYRLADSVYLLHDAPSERASRDLSWAWREATADLIEPGEGRVRLHQVQVLRRVPAAEQQQAGLRAQARLLARLDGRAGLPRLLGTCAEKDRVTLVTAHPPGWPWAEVYGPGPQAADRLTAAGILAAAANLCAALGTLHERGASHRALHPDAIFVHGDRCLVRDAGLAAIPPFPGESETAYRAPEQERAPYATGASTDVYQLAAVVYHTLTGYPPVPAGSPPIRAAVPGFPEKTERALLSALDSDPVQRPADAATLAAALRAGRGETVTRGPLMSTQPVSLPGPVAVIPSAKAAEKLAREQYRTGGAASLGRSWPR